MNLDPIISAVIGDFTAGGGDISNKQPWQVQQLAVATGVTSPEKPHSATYVALIEELEAENRMLRARNERLTMVMKHLERIIQENVR